MKSSKQARREARQLFRGCQVNGVLDENRVRLVIRSLVESKPRGYIGILDEFQRWIKLDAARRAAKIETAVPLEPQFQTQLQEQLKKRYGSNLNFTFVHNPALLGGLRIQVGGDVYDGTVRGRLNALTQSF